jgi:uncharacterized protein
MRTAMEAGRIGSAELADLVARSATVELALPVARLPRLAVLAPPETGPGAARLDARLTFEPGTEGHPRVHLVVTGTNFLVCQRCLGPLEFPVAIDVLLTMVGGDAEAGGLADPFDTVLLEEGGLAVPDAIEDEVLAALPLAPKHAGATACGATGGIADQLDTGETHRPLAGLADLLARNGRRDGK